MNDKLFETIASSIEQIFRYVIPGFIFAFLLRVSYCCSKSQFIVFIKETFLTNIGSQEFYIYVLIAGMIIYSLHRLIFEVVDWFFRPLADWLPTTKLLKWLDIWLKDQAGRIIITREDGEDRRKYLIYKTAIAHFYLILFELLLIFKYFKVGFLYWFKNMNGLLPWLSNNYFYWVLYGLSLLYYFYLHLLTSKLYK